MNPFSEHLNLIIKKKISDIRDKNIKLNNDFINFIFKYTISDVESDHIQFEKLIQKIDNFDIKELETNVYIYKGFSILYKHLNNKDKYELLNEKFELLKNNLIIMDSLYNIPIYNNTSPNSYLNEYLRENSINLYHFVNNK
jgi:hypothetical protein